jgi:hypothetical protein
MLSLKELTKMVIIKHGLGRREVLPIDLQKDLQRMEETIQLDVVGNNYYEYYRICNNLEFDISWHAGTWTFSQRWEFGEHENSTIYIRAGRESFISPVWKDIFSLPYDLRGGFMISDFNLDLTRRQIRFHGYYYTENGLWKGFKSTFWFSQTGFYVRVRYQDEYADGDEHINWEMTCFQQPDTMDKAFQRWDDEFHNPPFIQPVYDALVVNQ